MLDGFAGKCALSKQHVIINGCFLGNLIAHRVVSQQHNMYVSG